MIPKDLRSYYRLHSRFYDLTRWSFLFGRNSLKEFLPELPESSRILDLGCGTGKHLQTLLSYYPEAKITGIDQSKEMLNHIPARIREAVDLKNESYTPSVFSEDTFDLILCSYSLTMMEHSDEVLQAIKKHLKSKGKLLVVDFDTTPFLWFDQWMKKNHVHFVHQWFERLNDQFEMIESDTSSAYFGLYTYTVFLGRNL